MRVNNLVVLIAVVTFYTWDVRRELRRRRLEEFVADCRRADAILRPMGFVPDSFDVNEATWRNPDGKTAKVCR